MTTYANQMTVTLSKAEAILHFAFVAPQYDADGDVLSEPVIINEQNIVLTADAFEMLRQLMEKVSANAER